MGNNTYNDIDEIEYKSNIKIFTILIACLGIVFLFLSNSIFDSNAQTNLWANLFSNIGAVLLLGGTYTFINELYLRNNFAQHIQTTIDTKLNTIGMHENILNYGLSNLRKRFTKESLLSKVKESKDLTFVAMRNETFFSYYSPEILNEINNNDLNITAVLMDPESSAVPIVAERFVDSSQETVKKTINNVINNNIKKRIYEELAAEKKENLKLLLFDRHPTYSAYIFNEGEELWYIPYFYRKEKRDVPVFILEGKNKVISSEIYKDIMAMVNQSKKVILNNET